MRENEFCIFNLDSPDASKVRINSRNIEMRGWIIPKGKNTLESLQIIIGGVTHKVQTRIRRDDIVMAFADINKSKTKNSGFEINFNYDGGDIVLEACFGNKKSTLIEMNFEINEDDFSTYYNPFLASNWAEHSAVLAAKKDYYFEPKNVIKSDYSLKNKVSKNKVIAFYLPQFHPIPENDKAWGKGFTEWSNVTTAKARFIGHNQPFLPADLGYYDLRIDDNIKQQIDLAKTSGVDAFCIYYYWFSGKKILDTPINKIVQHKEWDFNFMICWANENWTKRWDGKDKDVILEQKYHHDDPINFIKDIEHILLDERYIKHDSKPMLAVYRPEHLDDSKRYTKVWRDYFKKTHNTDLHLVYVMGFSLEDPGRYGFDAAIEFAPTTMMRDGTIHSADQVNVNEKLIDKNFVGSVINYRNMVRKILNSGLSKYNFPVYRSVTPSWDNDARKKGKDPYVFTNESPVLFQQWLRRVIGESDNYIFINAWNEWAEGSVMEPTIHYGHALLNRARKELNHTNKSSDDDIAVVVFIDNNDMWDVIYKKIKDWAPQGKKVDVYVSSPSNVRIENISKMRGINIIHNTVPHFWARTLSMVNVLIDILDNHSYSAIIRLYLRTDNKSSDLKNIDKILGNINTARTLKIVDRYSSMIIYDSTVVSEESEHKLNNISHHIYQADHNTLSIKNQSIISKSCMFSISGKVDGNIVVDLCILPEDFISNKNYELDYESIENVIISKISRRFDEVKKLDKMRFVDVRTKEI